MPLKTIFAKSYAVGSRKKDSRGKVWTVAIAISGVKRWFRMYKKKGSRRNQMMVLSKSKITLKPKIRRLVGGDSHWEKRGDKWIRSSLTKQTTKTKRRKTTKTIKRDKTTKTVNKPSPAMVNSIRLELVRYGVTLPQAQAMKFARQYAKNHRGFTRSELLSGIDNLYWKNITFSKNKNTMAIKKWER